MGTLLEAQHGWIGIWVSEFSVSSMCTYRHLLLFCMLEIWKHTSLTSEIPVQFLFCNIRPTCCYFIEWFSVQGGGVLVREMESGRVEQAWGQPPCPPLCHLAGSLWNLWESLCSCMLFTSSGGFLWEIILEWHCLALQRMRRYFKSEQADRH